MAVALKKRLGDMATGAAVAGAGWLVLTELGIVEVAGVDPARWLWAAVLLGILLGLLDRTGWVVWPAVLALVSLVLVESIPAIASQARAYVRADPLPKEPVDAVVVLSAGVNSDGRINGIAVDRLLEGVRLIRGGLSEKLVLSRVFTQQDGNTVTSDADQKALLASTGFGGELRILAPVGSTRLEAVRAREMGEREGWKRIIVVTSPIHTRRACAAFETVGFTVVCRPSPDRTIALGRLSGSRNRTIVFGQWLYETLGWWQYRVRGWILTPRAR